MSTLKHRISNTGTFLTNTQFNENNVFISVANTTTVNTYSVVSSGMLVGFDANNSTSYSGTGTTWHDVSGNSNNGTLENAPVWVNSTNPNYFNFNGTNQDVYTTTTLSNFNGASLSICGRFQTTSAAGHKIVGFESSQTGSSGSYDKNIYVGTDGKLYWGVYNAGTHTITSANTVTDGNWHTFAVVCNSAGPSSTLYVDGQLQSSMSYISGDSGNWLRIASYTESGWTNGASGYFSGNLSSIYVYNRALSLSEVQQNANAESGLATSVALTTYSNTYNRRIGSSNVNFYLDEVTLPNTPTSVTYSSASVSFPGAINNLQIPTVNTASYFPSGTANATFEAWIYPTTANTNRGIISKTSVSAEQFYLGITSANVIRFESSTNGITGTTIINPNTWYHVAATSSGGTGTIWLNGNLEATGSVTLNNYTNPFYLGALDPTNGSFYYPFAGLISNARVSNNIRYSAPFGKPTAPFVSDANTVFLLNAYTTQPFVDSGPYKFPITNTSVTANTYGPFLTPGSLQFNGTNSITAPSNTIYSFSGQFTIEGWFYWTQTPTGGGNLLGVETTGGLCFYYDNSTHTLNPNVYGPGNIFVSTFNPSAGKWYHIALTRNASNLMTMWVNGVSVGSITTSASYTSGTYTIGYNNSAGLVSNFRIVNGTSIYNSNFTPPTSPLSVVANTSLLLNTYVSQPFVESSNNITITNNGSVTSNTLSPVSLSITTTTSVPNLRIANTGVMFVRGQFDEVSSFITSLPISYLIVAGGGSGGNNGGGGGGAGGVLTGYNTLNTGTTYNVVVGPGSTTNGGSGINSSFAGLTAIGGGGGGVSGGNGSTGGSGGGGGAQSASNTNGGSGTSGQGNAGGGGLSTSPYPAGGGGGAGAVGQTAPSSTQDGAGGIGILSSITGTSTYYGGGGGGGSYSSATVGAGGLGGGGSGATGSNPGVAGTPNTGGGGGGGGSNQNGGNGGSGVVIISYPTSSYIKTPNTTGSPTVTTNSGNTIYKFTANGSITF